MVFPTNFPSCSNHVPITAPSCGKSIGTRRCCRWEPRGSRAKTSRVMSWSAFAGHSAWRIGEHIRWTGLPFGNHKYIYIYNLRLEYNNDRIYIYIYINDWYMRYEIEINMIGLYRMIWNWSTPDFVIGKPFLQQLETPVNKVVVTCKSAVV